jgi:hypothetical protein
MAPAADIQMTVTFDPTPEGFAAARDLLDTYEGGLDDEPVAVELSRPSAPPVDLEAGAPLDDGDIIRGMWEAASDDGLSRPFLKLLPSEDEGGLTMAEIGQQLKAYWEDDRPLTAPETRAVHRNIKRMERYYKRNGQMPEDRVIVHQEWSRSEGVGRYYVSKADHDVIQAL